MKTPAWRPYSVLFAANTASRTSMNGRMLTTGPKTSSAITFASEGTPARTVGS
ncbi:hypothetical protein QFZ40_002078 [Arthrobacter pascens]|nr:hypothetical protein [Arthrobacter pascens]